jgi:hypothetical protein
MAGLTSPGVQVTVIDESFYNTALPGTVPIIFVATKANKSTPSGSVAPGTLLSNLGKVWTITSQRDLTDTFGTPLFYTDGSGNAIHGGELNEYGLQAAYSSLGVSSRAYVVRADIDLSQLVQTSSEPKGDPESGTYWIDTASSKFGISEWNNTGKVFVNKTPLVINDVNSATVSAAGVPLPSFGVIGDYAMYITRSNENTLWYKNTDNRWVVVGTAIETSFGSPVVTPTFTSNCWQTSWPLVTLLPSGITSGSVFNINGVGITITGTTPNDIALQINASMPLAGVGAKSDGTRIHLYADASAQGGIVGPDGKITLANGTPGTLALLGVTAGTYGPVSLAVAPHFQFPQFATNGAATGSVYVKTTSPNNGGDWVVKYYNGTTRTWATVSAPIYATSEAAIAALDNTGGAGLTSGRIFVKSNIDDGVPGSTVAPLIADFKVYRRTTTAPTVIATTVGASVAFTPGDSFTVAETLAGNSSLSVPKVVTITTSTVAGFSAAISAAGLVNVSSQYDPVTRVLTISHKLGGDICFTDGAGLPMFNVGLYNSGANTYAANLYPEGAHSTYDLRASNWKPIDLLTSVVTTSNSAPTTSPANGTLWYSAVQDEVDIMIHNGTTWVGYQNYLPNTNPAGPIIRATQPDKDTGQSDGTPLVDGDIWIDSSDPEKYGQNVYVWNSILTKWIKQDLTDNTSPTGWLFADARWSNAGTSTTPSSITTLLTSDYLDPDSPDPALFPQGMKLWNTRRSGNNVKRYATSQIDITANTGLNTRFNNEVMDGSTGGTRYATARWVNATGNAQDGSGLFGRHAQRGVVVRSLKAMIDTNEGIRDTDTLVANLIATPGYTETIANMVSLNTARGLTAFVIGDTPFRLAANGSDLRAWGSSTTALDNSESGAVTYDEYLAMYYPSGFTNDNAGNNIVVPPSHMVLRTIAISDQRSYPWFAPAGTRRGSVDNATAVGFIKNGEFQQAPLPESLRNVLQDRGIQINPIATLPGAGLVVFGQKTRAKNVSSLDRINVSRLVAYLRRQLDLLARPFLFEPNDRITRNEIKQSAESLLLELVGQRAIYDFIVQCDEQNNTPARIDRNELHVDIAIEPVKAVEFIYIPLRLKNTGDIAAGR